jgi:signal transduction histidine kinase
MTTYPSIMPEIKGSIKPELISREVLALIEDAISQNKNLYLSGYNNSMKLSDAVHDIKQPLSIVKGFTYLAIKSIDTDPQKAKEYLQKVDKNADLMTKLLNELSDSRGKCRTNTQNRCNLAHGHQQPLLT